MGQSYAGPLSIHYAAGVDPLRVAMVAEHQAWTYAELSERVSEVQRVFRRRAYSPRARIAWVAEPTASAVIVLSAAIEEGIVPVMLHPRWPQSLRSALIDQVGALPGLPIDSLLEEAQQSEGEVAKECHGSFDPEAELAVFFTSGSTGAPKGVRLSYRALLTSARSSGQNLGWEENDRWALNLPLAHIGGFSVMTRTRLARRTMVLYPSVLRKSFEPHRFSAWLTEQNISLVSLVPTMLHRLVSEGLRAPRNLRVALLGGAAASLSLLKDAGQLGWPVVSTYGMTEASSQITTQRVGVVQPTAGVGKVLDGWSMRIVEGRIQVRGDALMSGYIPADTTALVDGWFDTGDLGRLDSDGTLHIEGRAKDMIISGGENVAPGRVEVALRSLPQIEDAVVFGHPDDEWGEVVWAAVQPTRDAVDVAAIERQVFSLLARFERPRRYLLVPTLPLLPNGKVDRHQARLLAERTAVADVSSHLN